MTISPSLENQGLIVSTLKGTGAVMALVNGVYDSVPSDPWGAKLAYISLGAEDIVLDDADCIDGELVTLQIDVWSRKPGRVACKQICAAVKDALHERDLVLTENALVELRLVLFRILQDPDGLTAHGVMQFTATIEAP